jgi:hypothetical protein
VTRPHDDEVIVCRQIILPIVFVLFLFKRIPALDQAARRGRL